MVVALAGFLLHSLPCCSAPCSCSAAIQPCSARSSTRCCRSICAKTSWWGAMRWWRPALLWRFCWEPCAAACSPEPRTVTCGLPAVASWWRLPATSPAGAYRRPRRRHPSCTSTPIPSPKPGATSASPGRTGRSSWPSSASPGSGSTGALFLAQFPAYAKGVLGGGEGTVTLLLATFTVGIGLGSLLCEKLSGGHVEIGLVPFGSIGLTLFGLDIALASPGTPAGRCTAGHR
jgi:hypothetical protein